MRTFLNVHISRNIPTGHAPTNGITKQNLAESSRYIPFGAFILGRSENIVGIAIFDKFAEQEKRRFVGNSRRLLHVVRDYYYRDLIFQFFDEFFYFTRRDGVERGSRFVH